MMTQDQRLEFIDRLAATPEILSRLPQDAQNELRVHSLSNQQRLQQPSTASTPAAKPQPEKSKPGEAEQTEGGSVSRYPLRSRRRTSTIGEEQAQDEREGQPTPVKADSEAESGTEPGSSPCKIRIVGAFGTQSE